MYLVQVSSECLFSSYSRILEMGVLRVVPSFYATLFYALPTCALVLSTRPTTVGSYISILTLSMFHFLFSCCRSQTANRFLVTNYLEFDGNYDTTTCTSIIKYQG